jgi:hypothetical protein
VVGREAEAIANSAVISFQLQRRMSVPLIHNQPLRLLMLLQLLPHLMLCMCTSIASQPSRAVTSRPVRLVAFPQWRNGGFGSLDRTPIGNKALGLDDDVDAVEPRVWDADSYQGRQRIYNAVMRASPMAYSEVI